MVASNINEQVDAVVDSFCAAFGVERSKLLSRKRTEEVCECRFSVYAYLNRQAKMSFNRIGTILGRDHGAVMWGIDSFDRMITDPRFNRLYQAGVALCGDSIPWAPHVATQEERLTLLEKRVAELEKLLTTK